MIKIIWTLFLFIPLVSWATINPDLIKKIGDELYFEANGETYDCAEVQSLVDEGNGTLSWDTWTRSFCQLVGTRKELLVLTDKIQQAIGRKKKIEKDEPERKAFLKEYELSLFLEAETGNNPSFKNELEKLWPADEELESVFDVYSYRGADLGNLERKIKKNREFFFSLDVQAKSLADLSFERSLTYGNDREAMRQLCGAALNLQEKLKCDNLYQILTMKTMYEILGISSLNSSVSIINIYGGL